MVNVASCVAGGRSSSHFYDTLEGPRDRDGHRYYIEEDIERMRSRSSRRSKHRSTTKHG